MNAYNQLQFGLATKAASGPVSLGFLPETARFSLRIDPDHLAAASDAFGLALPARIGEACAEGARRALCLGPDEWILWAAEAEESAVEDAFASLAETLPHSLVSVSDREVALFLEGPEAATLLSVGCPIDLSRIAPGSGKRTVLDTVQVVLFREAPDRWAVEVWRSFLPHVWELLNTANRELAAGL
jgi:sarcosine oxidase, subunit gamma